jgi:hypothetical protein
VINLGIILSLLLTSKSTSGSLFMLDTMYKGENYSGVLELYNTVADMPRVGCG